MRYPILFGKLAKDSSHLSTIFADPNFINRLVAPLKPIEVMRKVGYKA